MTSLLGATVTRSSLSASSSLAGKRLAWTNLASLSPPLNGEVDHRTTPTPRTLINNHTHSRWFSNSPRHRASPPLDSNDTRTSRRQQHQQKQQFSHEPAKKSVISNNNGVIDQKKIHHILFKVPVGSMDSEMVSFCHNTMNQLCEQHTVETTAAAEEILDRLAHEIDRNRTTCASTLYLYSFSYTRVIRSWARTGPRAEASIFYAHSLLTKMQQRHDAHPEKHPAPDTHTYSAFLYACTLSTHDQAVAMAQEIVRVVEAKSLLASSNNHDHDGDPTAVQVQADTSIYNALILVYANQADRHYGAAAAAEDCLLQLSKLAVSGGPRPDTQSFNRVLKAWTMSQEDNGANRALEILKLLIKLQDQHDVRPDTISFGTVINGFARRKRPVEAHQVFQQALEYFDAPNNSSTKKNNTDSSSNNNDTTATTTTDTTTIPETPRVDLTNCFNTIALAWAKSGHAEAPERVEGLLRDAYARLKTHKSGSSSNNSNSSHQHSHNIVVIPDVQTHTHCMEAHAKSGRANGMDRADQLLRDMVYSFVNSNKNNKAPAPSTGTFGVVIHGWLRSERPESGERAEALLRLMLDLAEGKGVDCAPEANTFTMCLLCWTNAKTRSPQATVRAYNLLEMMEQRKMINFHGYKAVINMLCHTRRSENTFQAVKLLQRMQHHVETKEEIEPPPFMVGLYTAVISALAKVQTPEAAELALQTLRGMPEGVEATSRAYTGVIHAFSRLHGKRPATVAIEIFEEMKQLDADPASKVALDKVVFLSVLERLASAGSPAAGNEACRVLGLMIELHENGRKDIEPSSECYDACLLSLTRSRDPANVARAADLLKALVTKYNEKALSHLASPEGFQAVIRACNNASPGEASQQAEEIARLMEEVSNAGDLPVQTTQ
jgi:pentatricopeptide repeat protein